MKLSVVFLFAVCAIAQARPKKTYTPYDKNANINFINMEGGAGVRPATPTKTIAPTPNNPPNSPVNPAPVPKPTVGPTSHQIPQAIPAKPVPAPTPQKPTTPIQAPTAPPKVPAKPAGSHPAPKVGTPVTTPGPGTVKQLVTFYDSQGKASLIRPYSYSQAVKQG